MVLRGTKKLLDRLGGSALILSELPASDGDWYANLLWLDRQKCLLVTHAGTLFSVFLPGARVADLRPIGPYVVAAIEMELRAEKLPLDTFGQLDAKNVCLARTASRSTLGFMNEMAFHLRYQVERDGGVDRCDSGQINQQLRRTPYKKGDYVFPLDLVAQLLAARDR
jgi:hypothetical protein